MAAKTLADRIKKFNPCEDGVRWLRRYTSASVAWAECKRADWMIWAIERVLSPLSDDDGKKLMLCCCDMAATAVTDAMDHRLVECLEVTRQWIRGVASSKQQYDAAWAARSVFFMSPAESGQQNAALAVFRAAAISECFYDAPVVVARVAGSNGRKWQAAMNECADIVRGYYPKPPRRRKVVASARR